MTRRLLVCVAVVYLLGCGRQAGEKAEALQVAREAPEVILGPSDLKLEQVLDRYAQALGGRERLLAVKSIRLTGRMTNSRDVQGAPITIEKKRAGGKFMRRLEVGGGASIQAVDGSTVWEVDPGVGIPKPRPIPEPHSRRFRHWAFVDGPLLDYQKKGNRVELLGKQKLDGADYYRLRLTYFDGDVSYYLIDAKTFLPKQVVDVVQQGGAAPPFEVHTDLSDYRKVGGIAWPFAEETVTPTLTQKLTWEKVELDVPLDDKHFAMPS